jgi:peptidyl-tRNA hydrolase
MSIGKSIAQAGHAYLGSLSKAHHVSPKAAQTYSDLEIATKICLDGGSEASMLHLHDRLNLLNIPSFLVVDQGHVELPHFDGNPTVTALGVGPLYRQSTPGFLKKLALWKGPHNPKGSVP